MVSEGAGRQAESETPAGQSARPEVSAHWLGVDLALVRVLRTPFVGLPLAGLFYFWVCVPIFAFANAEPADPGPLSTAKTISLCSGTCSEGIR